MKRFGGTLQALSVAAALTCYGVLGAGVLGTARAEVTPGSVEAGPFLGGYVFDHDLKIKNNLVYGLRAGYWLTNQWAGEFSVEGVPTEERRWSGDASVVEGHLDLLYHLVPAGKFQPYLAAGLGGALYHADSIPGTEWNFLIDYGVGVKYWINDSWAARLDLRQPVTFDDTNMNFMYTLGVSYLFGAAPAPAPEPAASPAPPPAPAPPAPPAPAPVVAPAPAPTASLLASPQTIQQGQATTLSWSAGNAKEASIDGVGAVDLNGSRSVSPTATTTYRLAARGDGGPAEASTTVTVTPPPAAPAAPKATLSANPATVEQGKATTLSWSSENATEAGIDGVGPVNPNGSQAVTPSQSTTYRFVARGPGGTAEATAPVTVAVPADSDHDGVPDSLDKCPDTPVGVAVDAQGCPLDADKDGVPDYLDKCPNTPVGVAVDPQGCPLDSDKDGVPDYLDKCPGTPAGVAVDAQGCPLDSDKDGVPDYLDKCPGTPAGVAVDAQGCPLDSDKDGVPDYLDKCPNTPMGKKVDSTGCPPAPQVVELKVYFDFDKYDVKAQYMDQIQKVAEFMKANPSLTAVIEGHTDNVGTEEYNLKLSTRRANAVAKILTDKFGVSMERISAQSLGETKPVASNATAEGRAKNRRVYAILEVE